MANFLKNVFEDMKESAKAQHELDKANFAAVKAEAKAQWEEAKAWNKPEARKAAERAKREGAIAQAKERAARAQERIDAAKKGGGGLKYFEWPEYKTVRSGPNFCRFLLKGRIANKTLTFLCYHKTLGGEIYV